MLVQARGEAALAGGSDSAARRRAPTERDGPERMCIVTRERRAPEDLIRFVAGPDGSVVPDIRAKLPGRGVWVTARTEIVEAAERIARAAGLDVGGVEVVIDDRDGTPRFYDINAMSNFVADPLNVLGWDPHDRLIDFLQDQLKGRKAA